MSESFVKEIIKNIIDNRNTFTINEQTERSDSKSLLLQVGIGYAYIFDMIYM